MLTIIGSKPSPFVRMVRITAIECGFPFELAETGSFLKLTADDKALIKKNNPLQRVPTLVDDGQEVFESRVICDHLLRKAGKLTSPRSIQAENFLSAIHGVLDTGVMRYMILMSDPQINGKQGYFLKMQDRLSTTLAWLNDQAKAQNVGAEFDILTTCLVAMMDWVEKREVTDLKPYANLQAVRQKWAERPSVIETRIPV